MADSPDLVAAMRLLDAAKDAGFTFQRLAPGPDGPSGNAGNRCLARRDLSRRIRELMPCNPPSPLVADRARRSAGGAKSRRGRPDGAAHRGLRLGDRMINFQLEQAGFISRQLQGLHGHDLAAVGFGNSISELSRADLPTLIRRLRRL